MDDMLNTLRLTGDMSEGIWHATKTGRYYVVVGGQQIGVWTKRRWAKRDLRRFLRERKEES